MLGTFHHICIQTNNYGASLDFYHRVLGFRIIQESAGFHGRAFNTWLQWEGGYLELQTAKEGTLLNPASDETEGLVHLCFYVENIECTYQHLKSLYPGHFLSKQGADIYQVENGSLFKLKAPEGTVVEFRDNPGI